MPNVSWQEPQIVVDLLALCLDDDAPGLKCIAVVSPWFSNVEITLRPGPWYREISRVHDRNAVDFRTILIGLLRRGWAIHVVVLKYGRSRPSNLSKQHHGHELKFLRELHSVGAKVHQVENLHAKGIITPHGVLAGSTNYTKSGLYLQIQNACYFAHDHSEYTQTRDSLLTSFNCRDESSPP